MIHRFTLYEQRLTKQRRINRRISIAVGAIAVAAFMTAMWLTSIPGMP